MSQSSKNTVMLIPGHIVHAPCIYEVPKRVTDFIRTSIDRFNVGVVDLGNESQDLSMMEDQNKYLTRESPCRGHAICVSTSPIGVEEMRKILACHFRVNPSLFSGTNLVREL